MITAEKLRNELSAYYGTGNYYNMFPKLTYTDGVKAFAELAGAYWLLTDIALFLMDKKFKNEEYIYIKFTVKDSYGVLTFDDGNGNILLTKDYKNTDCPSGEWEMFHTNGVLMLPSEY